MKRFAIIFSVILWSALSAFSADDLIAKADSAYNAASYQEAVELYSAAIDSLGRSSDLYYNLGNSYFRIGKPGRAIVAYERALRIDPNNTDTRANLEFVNSRIADRPGERGTILEQVIRAIVMSASPNAWAWIALVLFLSTLGAVAVYCFTQAVWLRKTGFFGAGILFVVTCFAIFIAVKASSRATDHSTAVVVEPSTILSTSPRAPRNRAEEAMLLHEGTLVKIRDSVRVTTDSVPQLWLDVQIDNNHRAWIDAADVERI